GAAHAYVRALAGAAAWATDDREEEAVRMLEAAGFDREGAVQLFGIRARTVAPADDGIAVLTLAHGLARSGAEVRVIEAARRQDRLGTGITLLENALRALDRI